METTNTNKKRFVKTNTVNLVKSFDSFEDGYSEIIRFLPEIKVYCGETIMHNAVICKILDSIKDNIPSPTDTNYPNTLSFSIDAHEVGLKTDSGIAFGWRIAFDRDAGKTIYKFRVTVINVSKYRKEILSDMESAGWSYTTFSTQSRFWKSVEGGNRRRYNNNRRYDNRKPRFERDQEQSKEVNKEETVKVQEPVLDAKDPAVVPDNKPEVKNEIPGSGFNILQEALQEAIEKAKEDKED